MSGSSSDPFGGMFNIYPNYTSAIGNTIVNAANMFNLPPTFLGTQMAAESGFNQNAIGTPTLSGTAQGIAQFMPGTAQAFDVNSLDPTSSIYGAASYDNMLLGETGSFPAVLSGYGTGVNAFNTVAANVGAPSVGSYVPGSSQPNFGPNYNPNIGGGAPYNTPEAPQVGQNIANPAAAQAGALESIANFFSNIAHPFIWIAGNPGSAIVLFVVIIVAIGLLVSLAGNSKTVQNITTTAGKIAKT